MTKELVNIELSNNQALHLWGILASYSHDTTQEMKSKGIFKKDGTPKQRGYRSEAVQEQMDNIELCKLLIERLENTADLTELS